MNKDLRAFKGIVIAIFTGCMIWLVILYALSCGGENTDTNTRKLNEEERIVWLDLLDCMAEPYIDIDGIEREGVVTDSLNVPEPVISLDPKCNGKFNSSTGCMKDGVIHLIDPLNTTLLHEYTHWILKLFTGRWFGSKHDNDYFRYTRNPDMLDQRLCINPLVVESGE